MDTLRQTTEAPSAQHRRPARWAAAALALSFLAAGCGAPDRSGAPSGAAADDASGAQSGYDSDTRAAAAAGVRLTLTIEPQVGDAPLTVRFHATLDGDLDDPARYQCATAAFALGDDNVQLIPPPEDCVDGVQRTYDTEHVYAAAGSYRASVRLIARPVEASKPVQVLVHGATPTAVPMAANPGPTIVIATPGLAFPADATPAPRRTAESAEPPGSVAPAESAEPATTRTVATPTARTTRLALAPTTAVAVATIAPPPAPTAMAPSAPPSPTPGARAVLAVLPADLYYLGGSPTRLWRLPATGDEPEAIDGPTESTDRFAVSTIGFIARQQRGMITVLSPTGGRRKLVEPMDDGGDGRADRAGPVWSRDGHLLAYSVDGHLKIFDVVTFEEREVGVSDGAPMGFSRDSRWLLMGLDNGRIGRVDVASGDEQVIPLPDGSGQPAGWLPDRNVLWSSGAGLRFVTIDDPLTITPVIEPTTRVSKVLVRSDHRALALVDRGAGSVMAVVDLLAPTVAADVVGAPLDVAVDADLAWAPDGRTLAVAGPSGLALVDPATGARVPLVGGPTSAPVWMLSGRHSTGGDGG